MSVMSACGASNTCNWHSCLKQNSYKKQMTGCFHRHSGKRSKRKSSKMDSSHLHFQIITLKSNQREILAIVERLCSSPLEVVLLCILVISPDN